MKQIKTYKGWGESKQRLLEYLHKNLEEQPHQEIDEKLFTYLLEVVPPVYISNNIMQMGEPYTHIESKPVYFTFTDEGGKYFYVGLCYEGGTTQPPLFII